jgi:NADH:ubiquinone reductase (H+-translocating)
MLNIPDSEHPRIVVIGAGFAGFNLVDSLRNKPYQIVLLDKNNYHQFQPLFYQVAMAGLEPSSITFPMRKAFQNTDNVVLRIAELIEVMHEDKKIYTDNGIIYYDYLVLSMGATTNYFGNRNIEKYAFPLKSVSEALLLRNTIFEDYELALMEQDYDLRQNFMDIVIVGGGPTGVELAGALAEMRSYILPRDYKELDSNEIDIYLVQGAECLLKGMSTKASEAAKNYLTKMGVKILFNSYVTDIDENTATLKDGSKLKANKVIWAAGITCVQIKGIPEDSYVRGNRIKVSPRLEAIGMEGVYVLGDQAYCNTDESPNGHPQVAQVAIQMSKYLAKQFVKQNDKAFVYKDLGSMATIGRNKAVVDLPNFKFKGFFAWILWLFVHIRSLIGVRNKLIVFINWIWNYVTYDQSLRLIIKPAKKTK